MMMMIITMHCHTSFFYHTEMHSSFQSRAQPPLCEGARDQFLSLSRTVVMPLCCHITYYLRAQSSPRLFPSSDINTRREGEKEGGGGSLNGLGKWPIPFRVTQEFILNECAVVSVCAKPQASNCATGPRRGIIYYHLWCMHSHNIIHRPHIHATVLSPGHNAIITHGSIPALATPYRYRLQSYLRICSLYNLQLRQRVDHLHRPNKTIV